MTNNDLGKIKSRRTVADPLTKRTEKNVSLETYLRHSLEDFDQFDQDLPKEGTPIQRRLKPDRLPDEQDSAGFADKWNQRFETEAMAAPKPPRRVFPSIIPYLAIAIMCGVVSGAAVLYVMVRQSLPQDDEAATHVSISQASTEPSPSARDASNPARAVAAASNDETEKAAADTTNTPSFFSAVDGDAKDLNSRHDASAVTPSAMPEAIASLRAAPEAKPSQNSTSGAGLNSDAQLQKLTSDQERKLLKRATDLLVQNDIAGARLILHYLASHGSAKAAFSLAESYDPKKWSGHHVAGMVPDENEARTWYARAAELGSVEADAALRKNKP